MHVQSSDDLSPMTLLHHEQEPDSCQLMWAVECAHPTGALGGGGCSEYRSPRMSSASDRGFGGAAGGAGATGAVAAGAVTVRAADGGGVGSVASVIAPGGAAGQCSSGYRDICSRVNCRGQVNKPYRQAEDRLSIGFRANVLNVHFAD